MTDPNATQSFGTTAAVKPLGGTGPEAVDIDLDLPVLVQAAASPALAPVVPAAATAILSVAAQPAPAAPAATKPDWTDRLGKIINRLTRFWGVLGAMAGVGAVLSGMLGYWTIYHTVISGPTATSAPGPRMAAPALSIVVLPFANQTGDPQKGYIADALTTSISADLSRIREAFVIPAATAFIYRDKPVSVQEVGRDVGVRFVLNGSVLSSGEQVRINAQLSDAQSGAQLWSETFDGALGNLFALQDQVTNRIGNSIGREMVIVAARESETRKSSPKATDLMLRAAALRLKPQSLKNWQQIEELYRQVLALEPNNPRAPWVPWPMW